MWRIVMVLFISSVFDECSGQDMPEIKFVIKKNSAGALICPANEIISPKLIVQQRFRVSVESEVDMTKSNLTCHHDTTEVFTLKNFKKHGKHMYYATEAKNVGIKWHNNWTCTFDKIKHKSAKVICNITAYIRNSGLAPYLTKNGEILGNAISATRNDSFDSYQAYEFFDGESVKFTIQTTSPPALLQFSSNAHSYIEMSPFPVINTTSQVFLYLKLSKHNHGNFIDCRAASYTNTQSFVTRIKLEFKKGRGSPGHGIVPPAKCTTPMNCTHGTVVDGLAKEKILAMFIRNQYTLSILYEYQDEETLILGCTPSDTSDKLQPKWKYNESQVESDVVNQNVSYAEVTKGYKSFKLKPNQTRVTIACFSSNNNNIISTDVTFIQKKHIEETPDLIKDDDSGGTEAISIAAVSVTDKRESNENEGLSKGNIITIVGCGLVFIIVIAFVIIQLFKRKPAPPNPDSNINYENLQNTAATPAPSAWREVQYSAPSDRIANNDYAVPFKPSLGEMYATPVPKSQRHEEDNPAYASVGDLNATYTQAVPKQLRGVPVLPTNRESTYAELALKPEIAKKPNVKNKGNYAKGENPYAEITPSESSYANRESPYEEVRNENPYAEVASSECSYADPSNLQTKSYVNVFKDPRYVNAEGKSDYAEPAYCEINKIQK